jgi:hypothetical protein
MRSNHWTDISQIDVSLVNRAFPLDWQRKQLSRMATYCKEAGITFRSFCIELREIGQYSPMKATKTLFDACKNQKMDAKTLWLFVRDYLGLPAFAVDRHVRRILIDNGLPICHQKMLALCTQAGVDPNDLARRMFGVAARNPDWSAE